MQSDTKQIIHSFPNYNTNNTVCKQDGAGSYNDITLSYNTKNTRFKSQPATVTEYTKRQ